MAMAGSASCVRMQLLLLVNVLLVLLMAPVADAASPRIKKISLVHVNNSVLPYGLNDTVPMVVELEAPYSSADTTGECTINEQRVNITGGLFSYLVQVNDSDIHVLHYSCALHVAIGGGNHDTIKQDGVIKHQIQQIDGTVPVVDDMFMIFSSDKPARIGSVLSITLRAVNLTRGYTGKCQVNGVKDLEIMEAEDDGYYMTQYMVREGDASVDANATMPLECVVQNAANNTNSFKHDVELGFAIDAQRPHIVSTSLLFSSDHPAHEGTIIEIQITTDKPEPHLHPVTGNSCMVNNVSVSQSFAKSADDAFLITYVVGRGEAMWKAGELPVYCVVQDAAGNTATIRHFTDGNTLFARELKPVELDPDDVISAAYFPDQKLMVGFAIVAIASHSISKVCPHVGLPSISGYIITGILVGPYVLNFLSSSQIRRLRVIDELSLAYIGLTAGSKLHWKEMRPMMKSILSVTLWLTVVEYIVGTLTIAVLAGYIDFLQDTTDSERYAIALLAGCMMTARSPSSALAVIEETKSHGHFTMLVFAVTVMCDVVVICLFNINNMITESFLSEKGISFGAFVQLLLQLCCSVGMGLVLGKVMGCIILWRHAKIKRKSVLYVAQQVLKQALLLLFGWMIFAISHLTHPYMEPLLCCLVSGAVMWNCSPHPEELGILLKKLAGLVYVSFFTITGATLELDMLVKAMMLSIVLSLTRIVAIFIGSLLGGKCAGEDKEHSHVAWMAYVTQAGVTLGLAKQIQLLYPGWGSYFSTMIVAVVICNQIIGPPLLRYVLRHVGDAKKKEVGKVDGLKALVLTNNPCSDSAMSRLEMCGWNVVRHPIQISSGELTALKGQYPDAAIQEIQEQLRQQEPLDVVVVIMKRDEENFQVIRALTSACHRMKRITVLRVVVLVAGNDSAVKWTTKFADMPVTEEFGDTIDVVVVDRTEATDMLIELASCGKVVNTADIVTTPEDEEEDVHQLEEGDTSVNLQLPTRTVPGLRQSITRKVRRMMLKV
ncbi:TPA: hypothetical protein N0F65_013007 [Lagenidium giganteum]|uniref:Cation/H+ exchanger transmembrane domain-containing protein n=1 Tax=Lagenidium giganteum TaxID=4803 RepID=A0AAV2YQ30_9STRA|nr:TPA: hypothetical protein N0F65_013007 [Lagenidium giganteum]